LAEKDPRHHASGSNAANRCKRNANNRRYRFGEWRNNARYGGYKPDGEVNDCGECCTAYNRGAH
jgi:hypothetical protein